AEAAGDPRVPVGHAGAHVVGVRRVRAREGETARDLDQRADPHRRSAGVAPSSGRTMITNPVNRALRNGAATVGLALAVVASGVVSRTDSATTASWPGFRGPSASGIGAGPRPPDTWNVATGKNIAWTI